MSDKHICESCGHPVHHCATAGQCCPVVTHTDGVPSPCQCPSTSPANPDCACAGEDPWLRNHDVWRCGDDYPPDDPNRCQYTWDGLPDEARNGFPGHQMSCAKRSGHGGYHSTHNECGAPTGMTGGSYVRVSASGCGLPIPDAGSHTSDAICGRSAGPSGFCEEHDPERLSRAAEREVKP
jgi:hypothetical protein